ncbi:hypothetical protein M4D51_02490 [Microbacterium sp. p3-SID338]|uniref:hypothetical protein n=1 Tax=Microbacterium sp. p3-SID338 TaxID=2916214 RepID=UPI0021A62F60|nr:hypothetical protein [Microbacterium sp. p3-SID338]MCT1394591.1 hypothetical protein [Microbacterium sp. p3-SID338]
MSERIKALIAKQRKFAEELLAEAKAYYDETGPVEVETVFGDTVATVLLPFVEPKEFEELTERHPARPGNPTDARVWFNLHAVTRAYPGISLRFGDETDDLRRIRGDEIAYLWPEVFDAMPPEDQENFRVAVWAMHVWEPQKRKAAKKERESDPAEEVDQLPVKDLVDFIVEGGNPNG